MEDNEKDENHNPHSHPAPTEAERIEAILGVLSHASSAPALTDLQLAWNAECISLHEAVRVFWSASPLQNTLKDLLSKTELSEAIVALLIAAHEDLANGQCGAFLPIVSPNLLDINDIVGHPNRLLELFATYGSQRVLPSTPILESEYNDTVQAIPGIDPSLKEPLKNLLSTAKQLSELTFLGNLALIFSSEIDSFMTEQ